MLTAEDQLWGLRQAGRKLERYVDEFIELVPLLNWPDASLGACFQLGLDSETIRFVEKEVQSRCPVSAETRHITPAHHTSTYHSNSPNHLTSPNHLHPIYSSMVFLSPAPSAAPPRLPSAKKFPPPVAATANLPPFAALASPPPKSMASRQQRIRQARLPRISSRRRSRPPLARRQRMWLACLPQRVSVGFISIQFEFPSFES
ncbi:uncharacterized protein LOC131522837 [Onychostoma macrolepis]|uniref:uncharacterized protein LOC131522837 n=1 Tax=Onychostoma macrolepis TaxID=369639 RepID=UPI00272CBA93|nr:uncharacterized protein LOC131522837 [Onychostoma macrolepis]